MRRIAAVAVAIMIATFPAAAQDRTGVRDCDDFVVWFASCMRAAAVPPEMMPVLQAALDQMRSGRDYGGQMRQQLAGFGCRP
jgi:hypothetical protein